MRAQLLFALFLVLCIASMLEAQQVHWYPCNLMTHELTNATRAAPLQQNQNQILDSNFDDDALSQEEADNIINNVSNWLSNGGMSPAEAEMPISHSIRRELNMANLARKLGSAGRLSAPLNYAPVAECAHIYVPLNYSQPEGRQIEVFVKRVRPEVQPQQGKHTTASRQLWILQGGPGGSTDGGIERMMNIIYQYFDGDVELYTMDHRGVGRSTRLGCLGSQAETAGSEEGISISPNEMKRCAREIVDKYGQDGKAMFSTTGAAQDMKRMIELTKGDKQTFVYGVSYGTLHVSRMMQLPGIEDLVRGVIIDGICPQDNNLKYKWPTRDMGTEMVGKQLLSLCASDALCSTKLGKDASSAATDIFTALYQNGHCPSVSKILAQDQLRILLGSTLAGTMMRSVATGLLYRLQRCDETKDVPVIKFFIDRILNRPPGTCPKYGSDVLAHHIAFVERWRTADEAIRPNEEQEIWDLFRKTHFSFGAATNMVQFHKDWPLYEPDEYFYRPFALSKTKALLLNGVLDAQTPWFFAQRQYELIKTPDDSKFKYISIIPFAGHGTIASSAVKGELDCGMQILLQFLNNPDQKPNMSCTQRVAPVDFKGDVTLIKSLFGTDDVYEGVLPAAPADAAKEGVSPVVFGLVLSGLTVFFLVLVIGQSVLIALLYRKLGAFKSKYTAIR